VLRDKTFAKMEMAEFELVVRLHLLGSANCAKAVWNGMRERNYGRIVTSSASGLYGNFDQANYGAAKAAMVGLMNVLHLEGAKHDIRVNILAPTARTAMTEGLILAPAAELLAPETAGVYLDETDRTPETIAARWPEIADPASARPLDNAYAQTQKFVAAAAKAKGVKVGW
jgi:NAD(P)-dependent dehydrogenase (short-subunit alcohol dehydrogenase family)